MKKLTFIFMSLWMIVASCKKLGDDQKSTQRSVSTSPPVATAQTTCGQTQTQTLLAGQTIHAGTVSISNDQTNVYVSYSTSGGWQIQKTHLYVGTCSLIPTSRGGNPQIGLFPYQTTHSPAVTAFTYTIPLTGLSACYCVAAHCEVVLKDANGTIVQTETGWGQGNPFGGNSWAMVMNYCTQSCSTCSLHVGDYRTQTQGGWGAVPQGNNPGVYMQSHFTTCYPNGLIVGCPNGLNLTLSSAQAVTNFLPQGGTPAALTQSYTDPSGLNNVLAGQVVALSLTLMFDVSDPNFCSSPNPLSGLIVTSGPFQGWTVAQVLAEANKFLGGCSTLYTASDLNAAVTSINENFDNGTVVGTFLSCL